MDPVFLIGRYPYSHWVLGARSGGIESYRPLPQLGVPPCDRGNLGGSPWLLRFVTAGGLHKIWIEAMIVIDGRESCAGGEFARFSAGNALPDTLTQIIYIHFFSNGNVRDFF